MREGASRAKADAERASHYAAESAREQAERTANEKAEALTVLEIVLATAPVGFALFDRNACYIGVNSTFATMQPRPTNLNEVIRDVENMLRRLINEDIKFETALAPVVGLVNIDPGQLEQVLLNLALNARDGMPGGGTLQITTANIELGAADTDRQLSAPPGPYVLLTVSDTGVGMTQEVQKRVFEPFFTTKLTGKGTGLGWPPFTES